MPSPDHRIESEQTSYRPRGFSHSPSYQRSSPPRHPEETSWTHCHRHGRAPTEADGHATVNTSGPAPAIGGNTDAPEWDVRQHGPVLEAWGLTLTLEMARQVRRWRVEDECSWRVIATRADDKWGTETRGNQLFGEDLCMESARMLGESLNDDAWN
jgi:hypothetical protein